MSASSIYLIHGEEPFYIQSMVQEIQQKFPEHSPVVFENQVDLSAIFQVCSSASLFTKRAMILIKNPHFFTKALSDTDLKTLKDCLSLCDQNDHVLLCYCPGKKVDMRKKVAALFKKQGSVSEYKALNDWDQDKLFSFMQTHLKKENKTIDFEAMTALESSAGNSLSILAQSLDTLSTYVGTAPKISYDDVHALFTSQQASLFQVGTALKKADTQSLVVTIKALLSNHEPPVRILSTLHSQLKLFYQLRLLQQQRKRPEDMAIQLKKHPFYIKTILKELAPQLSLETLYQCVQHVSRADIDLKTGRKSADNALNYCIIALGTCL